MSDYDELFGMMEIEASLGMVAEALGRDANALVKKLRDLPRTLVEAFIETDFLVTVDGDIHVLNISKTMPDQLTAALASLDARSIAIITAWNPYSVKPERKEENLKRQSLLEILLKVRGDRWLHAVGTSKDGRWAEESFAILDLSYELATAFGQVFEQSAIVFCETGRVVELVPCSIRTSFSDEIEPSAEGNEFDVGEQNGVQSEGVSVIRTSTSNHSRGWSWDSLPDEIKKRFSPPPERSKFSSVEDYEEALGYWQGHVGRNIGLVLQSYSQLMIRQSTATI